MVNALLRFLSIKRTTSLIFFPHSFICRALSSFTNVEERGLEKEMRPLSLKKKQKNKARQKRPAGVMSGLSQASKTKLAGQYCSL